MAKRNRAKRKKPRKGGVRGEIRQEVQQALQATGRPVTRIDQQLARQQALLGRGKVKQATKVGKKIQQGIFKRPQQGIPLGVSYAEEEFNKNIQANRPNQQAIGGGREYITDPVTGQVTVEDSLAPEQQELYSQQIGNVSAGNQAFAQALNAGLGYGQAYDFGGLPAAPNTQDLAAERQRIEGEVYNRNKGLLDQSFDRRRQDLEDRLVRTGNNPGTPLYQKQMEQFNQEYTAADSDVRQQAIQTAGAEFDRSFNIGTQGRQNALGEMFAQRQQPLSELQALQGFAGGPTATPNFFNFQPIQYQGPQYLDYLQTGIDAQLGRGALGVSQQNANTAARPPVFAPQSATPSFSINQLPPQPVPQIPSAPNPIAAGFGAGLGAGIR